MKIQTTLWIIVMLGIIAGGVIIIDTKYVKHVELANSEYCEK